MRRLITGALGILCGIAIIIMAFCVKAAPAGFDEASFEKMSAAAADPATIEDLLVGEAESNKYYGGDAYTGMQQASAQAANNVLAMEETLLQTNENLLAVNENLVSIDKNLVKTNTNMANAVEAQQLNLEAACRSVSETAAQVGFFVLLAMGLMMLVSNVNPFLDGLEAFQDQKKEAVKAEEVPAE